MNDRPTGNKCDALLTDGSGDRCRNPAGKMTGHLGAGNCSKHAGSTPSGEKHGASLLEAARIRIADEVDPSIDRVVALRDGAKAEQVQLASARDLLDRAGVRVKDEESDVNITISFSMNDIDK